MQKIIDYYYTSYYKFFKLWQSDSDSARNAKAMIALILVFLWLAIFGKLYKDLVATESLDLSGKYKPLGYLITLPLIIFTMNAIKTSYPNDVRRSWIRALIVTSTIPIALAIMILLLR